MFETFINRENTIFEILRGFVDEGLQFLVVGGYAVSAFKHRFSVDADVIIRKEDEESFENFLESKKFTQTVKKELNHVYASEFVRYESKAELPVSIDLLVDGIGSRATTASFNFEELKKYSKKRKIIGTEKEIFAPVVNREILIVLKLHSGRLTDFRDIVALSKNLDLLVIESLIWRGNLKVVRDNVKKLLSLIEKKDFIDSFKGVFQEKEYDVDVKEVEEFRKLLRKRQL